MTAKITAEPDWAARNAALGTTVEELTVPGITPEELFATYGVPYYLKIDIEGADLLLLRGLGKVAGRPQYVSIESDDGSLATVRDEFAVLEDLGYGQFKLSPQHEVPQQKVPAGSPHGKALDHAFEWDASGLVGEDLPGPWLSAREALARSEGPLILSNLSKAIHAGQLTGDHEGFLMKHGYGPVTQW